MDIGSHTTGFRARCAFALTKAGLGLRFSGSVFRELGCRAGNFADLVRFLRVRGNAAHATGALHRFGELHG